MLLVLDPSDMLPLLELSAAQSRRTKTDLEGELLMFAFLDFEGPK